MDSDFFTKVHDSDAWRVDRPFFQVQKGAGGLRTFQNRVDGGLLRQIDRRTGAKPVFATSGIPGTVGSGTREVWRELIPMLQAERDFAVWPVEGRLEELLAKKNIILAETYPRLAYAAVLADDLPARRLLVGKTRADQRNCVCDQLNTARWVRVADVDLGDLERERADEDAFDSHLTAAAVMRCLIEGRELYDEKWVEEIAEGGMLLAGPVDPAQRARKLQTDSLLE